MILNTNVLILTKCFETGDLDNEFALRENLIHCHAGPHYQGAGSMWLQLRTLGRFTSQIRTQEQRSFQYTQG
jgi:hypothetical protein